MRRVLACLWVLVFSLRVFAAEPPADVNFERDVVYGEVGGEQLKLNLSIPKNAQGALPCIMVIHGGGWAAGDRTNHDNLTWAFAQHGYVSATIGYRFAPKHLFPAQVEDVKCAARFLRANAEKYHIDVNKFGAVGFSAGAHLSMMLGVMDKEDGMDDSGGSAGQPSKVQCVVSFFGPTDMTTPYPPASVNILKVFMGGPLDEKADAYKKASPITYVNAGDAPILMYQGTKDPLVPYDQAVRMVEAMTKAGVEGRAELIAGASHGWGGKELERTLKGTMEFFDQHLKAKAAPKAAAAPRRGGQGQGQTAPARNP